MKNQKLYGVLAYLSILILIPAFAARKDPFVRFHVNQGLILLFLNVISGLISFIPVIWFLGDILNCAVLVFCIWGAMIALRGEEKPLPIIGRFHLI